MLAALGAGPGASPLAGVVSGTIGADLLDYLARDAFFTGIRHRYDERILRYFAVRDVALGVRTLAATRPGGDVPRALAFQGVADTVDGSVLAGLVSTGRLRRVQGLGAVGMAAGTALLEYAAAWRLRRDR